MSYSVVVFDENGNRLAVLNNTGSPTYSRARNSADQVSFRIPRNDEKLSIPTLVVPGGALTMDTTDFTVDTTDFTADATTFGVEESGFVELFRIGRRFELLRASGGNLAFIECSGFISSHGYSDEYYEVEGFTEEILLSQMLTPAQFGYPLYSENQTIDAFVRQLSRSYVSESAKWAWGDYITSNTNIDTSINPTFLILDTISTDPETGEPTYETSGSVTLRFQKDADEEWERIRWVSDYFEREGDAVTTKVSYSQGATTGTMGEFTAPVAGSLTDIVGIIVSNPDLAVLDVRVDFETSNEHISPVLYSLEVVKRAPGPITGVQIFGNPNTLATPSLVADNATFFDVLVAALEPHGWEFQVYDHNLIIRETFGENRTNEYSVVIG